MMLIVVEGGETFTEVDDFETMLELAEGEKLMRVR